MTIDQFIVFVAMFCQFKAKSIPKEVKVDCLNEMTNCAITGAGEVRQDRLAKCVDKMRLK